ncbi:MAG: CopG family transcriptional regulator [Mesorhizobium sp.]|nr:MAG: CopG family transcriptional regulator [Mesorhizobium sp.]
MGIIHHGQLYGVSRHVNVVNKTPGRLSVARPKNQKQPARFTVTLDKDDYREVCALAANNDVSAAWVIRRAIQDYLGKSPAPVAEPTHRIAGLK